MALKVRIKNGRFFRLTTEPSICCVTIKPVIRMTSFWLHLYTTFFSSWLFSLLLFSLLLFSLLLSSLLSSLPLVVTSFWLIKSVLVLAYTTNLIYIKQLYPQITEKSNFFYIYFLSSKTLGRLDKNFPRWMFYRSLYIFYYRLCWRNLKSFLKVQSQICLLYERYFKRVFVVKQSIITQVDC